MKNKSIISRAGSKDSRMAQNLSLKSTKAITFQYRHFRGCLHDNAFNYTRKTLCAFLLFVSKLCFVRPKMQEFYKNKAVIASVNYKNATHWKRWRNAHNYSCASTQKTTIFAYRSCVFVPHIYECFSSQV